MRLRLRLAVTTLAVALPLMVALAWINRRTSSADERQRRVNDLLTLMLGGGRAQCESDPSAWALQSDLPMPPRGPDGHPLGLFPPELGAGPPHHPDGPPPLDPFSLGPGGPGWDHPPPDGERGPPPGGRGPPPHGPHGPRTHLTPYDAQLHSGVEGSVSIVVDDAVRGLATGAALDLDSSGTESRLLVRMPWETGPCAFIVVEAPPHSRPFLPPTGQWLAPLMAVLLGLLVSAGPLVRRIQVLTREVSASAAAQYGQRLSVSGADEIGDLARAFSRAQDEIRSEQRLAEQREAALRNFLSNTTHDVMIPLAALQGHLSALAAQAEKTPGLAAAEISQASDEAHYLASLVTNLAIAARLEAGEPDPHREPVDLRELVARAAGRHQTIARQHGVALDRGVPPEGVVAIGDVTMLEQAVSNAISNAVTYNRREGHVAVLLERQGTSRFALRVVDDGPGLDDEALAHVFDRGFRDEAARSRRPGGQGLGMAIAHEIAVRHGWNLSVRRSEFGGLEVLFEGPTA